MTIKAKIIDEGQRAVVWRKIFGSDTIAIRSPFPTYTILPERGRSLVYELDIESLTSDQRGRLVAHIAERFSILAAEVEAQLDEIGCPILAIDVAVESNDAPWRWL